MTYGSWSKNASSSRAIPVEKQLKRVMEDPAMPVFWGRNQAGMQAAEELSDEPARDQFHEPIWESPREQAKTQWLRARDAAVEHVKILHSKGLHKQLVNRLLEPWTWIAVVATATKANRNNLYNQRYHKDAQPEFQALAKAMWEAEQASTPKQLEEGEWHLPFVTDADHGHYLIDMDPLFLPKISAARCARVSYNNHDGTNPDPAKDLELYSKLMAGTVKHASPTCHQARAAIDCMDFTVQTGVFEHLRSNLTGHWVQFRKLIPGEFMPEFSGPAT